MKKLIVPPEILALNPRDKVRATWFNENQLNLSDEDIDKENDLRVEEGAKFLTSIPDFTEEEYNFINTSFLFPDID